MTLQEQIEEWNKQLKAEGKKAVATAYFPTRNLLDIISFVGEHKIVFLETSGSTSYSSSYTKEDAPLETPTCRMAVYVSLEGIRRRAWGNFRNPTQKQINIVVETIKKYNLNMLVQTLILEIHGKQYTFEKHSAKVESILTQEIRATKWIKGLRKATDKWQSLDLQEHNLPEIEELILLLPDLMTRICSFSIKQEIKYDAHCLIPNATKTKV